MTSPRSPWSLRLLRFSGRISVVGRRLGCLRLLFLLHLCAAVPAAMAQAPGTVDRRDIDGEYRRPDLQAPLFDALAVPLTPEQADAVVADMNLIARNLPDSTVVNHRMRSHALAVALRLHPDDRAAIIANGQLARGVRPAPLPADATVTPEGVARRLLDTALTLADSPQPAAAPLARLLFDLSGRLDPRLLPRITPWTYGATPDWPDAPASTDLEGPTGFRLFAAKAEVLVPGSSRQEHGSLRVEARAKPAEGHSGLKVALPEALVREMGEKGKEALRTDVEQRLTGLRAALRLRHEAWPEGWIVQFSVPDRSRIPLPALFAGMAVTLDALLGGEALDPECAAATGLDPGGRLIATLPVDDLLSAPALPGSPKLVILPPDAGAAVSDWILTNPERWTVLYNIALHQAADLADVMALTKQDRAPRLQQPVAQFAAIAAKLGAAEDPLAELRRPETVARLREVTAWQPQHLSATVLLRVAAGTPGSLTARGSLKHIDRLAAAVLSTDRKAHPLHKHRPPFQKSKFGLEGDALFAARNLIHPSIRTYSAEVVLLARMLDRAAGRWNAYLKNNGPPDPPETARQRAKVAALRAELEARGP